MTNPNDPAFSHQLMSRESIASYAKESMGSLEFIGLTKRELFAAMAMQAATNGFPLRDEDEFKLAKRAVMLADNLIAELNKK